MTGSVVYRTVEVIRNGYPSSKSLSSKGNLICNFPPPPLLRLLSDHLFRCLDTGRDCLRFNYGEYYCGENCTYYGDEVFPADLATSNDDVIADSDWLGYFFPE